MKVSGFAWSRFFLTLLVFALGFPAHAQDRAAMIIKKNDADGDGKVSIGEWSKKQSRFKQLDADDDGYLTLDELSAGLGGGKARQKPAPAADDAPPASAGGGLVSRDVLDNETLCAMTRSKMCNLEPSIKRGMFATGLEPRFPDGMTCRGIDDTWAMDYGFKRNRQAYHGGIDMPAPFGTPMLAAADGTVVMKTLGERSARGIEIVLRHSPDETGIPLWIYTQYAHFLTIPDLEVGQKVKMGQNLGLTGNSGINPKLGYDAGRRRPAIHFAVFYSTSPDYVVHRDFVIPVNGYWMDPNALYRGRLPLDTAAMKALPSEEKKVPIPVMENGAFFPADTRLIWPYACWRD
jgi:murein DD-endopeptidase MepM/ murein hydrolase activator NlpD